jgi:hypothetical protein
MWGKGFGCNIYVSVDFNVNVGKNTVFIMDLLIRFVSKYGSPEFIPN